MYEIDTEKVISAKEKTKKKTSWAVTTLLN